MDKSAFLTTLQTSPQKYSMFLATDIRVRIFETTAVVTCLWSSRGIETATVSVGNPVSPLCMSTANAAGRPSPARKPNFPDSSLDQLLPNRASSR